MTEALNLRLLFIMNPASGNNETDWRHLIQDYFKKPVILLSCLSYLTTTMS